MGVKVTPLTRFAPDETTAIENAVERMGRYLERPIELEVVVKP